MEYFEYFDERGAAFYEWLVKLRVFDWAYSITAREVEKAAPRGARILEVGPGVGKLASLLEGRGYRVVGVDVSPAMLRRAKRRTSADLVAGASWALPVRDGAFDGAVALFTLHHWGPHEGSTRSVADALRPGAKFVVVEADRKRAPVVGDHGCTAECLGEVLGRRFKVEIRRRFPLVIAHAERLSG
ncbi:MAG: class I SAM-dependent methyltransferase [Thermoproteus sp.]